jgi:alpha-L-fucosidase
MAPDTNTGHYVTVNLGASTVVTGLLLYLPAASVSSTYEFQTSVNGTTWTTYPEETQNTAGLQYQDTSFRATAQYVRVVFTSLPAGVPAQLQTFQIFH